MVPSRAEAKWWVQEVHLAHLVRIGHNIDGFFLVGASAHSSASSLVVGVAKSAAPVRAHRRRLPLRGRPSLKVLKRFVGTVLRLVPRYRLVSVFCTTSPDRSRLHALVPAAMKKITTYR